MNNGIKHVLFPKQCAVQIDSSPHCALNMRQWIGSALVQIMDCRLLGTKPLYTPMLGYYQLDLKNKFSEILIKIQNFHSQNASENIICESAATLSMRYESITVLRRKTPETGEHFQSVCFNVNVHGTLKCRHAFPTWFGRRHLVFIVTVITMNSLPDGVLDSISVKLISFKSVKSMWVGCLENRKLP